MRYEIRYHVALDDTDTAKIRYWLFRAKRFARRMSLRANVIGPVEVRKPGPGIADVIARYRNGVGGVLIEHEGGPIFR